MHLIAFLSVCLLFISTGQGFTVTKRASRLSSPSDCLVVQGANPEADQYATFDAAVRALGPTTTPKCIFIYPGIYKEQVRVAYKGNLTIYGYTDNTAKYSHNQVTIQSNQSSAQAGTLDLSSAVNFATNNVKVYNVNFDNSFGLGPQQSQAVAMTANGNHLSFYGCQFTGYQDTLYAKAGQQYYKRCYIAGTVDYIFGNAAAWFGKCTIESRGPGYITANSRTNSSDLNWYVLDYCTIRAAANATGLIGKVYLGRPWRALARVIYQNSILPDIIHPTGWATMAANATPIFEEYNNTGAGSNTAQRLYEVTATSAVSKTQLWADDYKSWIDAAF